MMNNFYTTSVQSTSIGLRLQLRDFPFSPLAYSYIKICLLFIPIRSSRFYPYIDKSVSDFFQLFLPDSIDWICFSYLSHFKMVFTEKQKSVNKNGGSQFGTYIGFYFFYLRVIQAKVWSEFLHPTDLLP